MEIEIDEATDTAPRHKTSRLEQSFACSGTGPCVGLELRRRTAGRWGGGTGAPATSARMSDGAAGAVIAAGGEYIVWAGGHAVHVLDSSTGVLRALKHDRPVTSLSLSPSGPSVVVGDSLGRLIEMDVMQPGNTATSDARPGNKRASKGSDSLREQPAEEVVTVASSREQPPSRGGRSGRSTRHWHSHPVWCCACTEDGLQLLSGAEEGALVVWPRGQQAGKRPNFLPRLGATLLAVTSSDGPSSPSSSSKHVSDGGAVAGSEPSTAPAVASAVRETAPPSYAVVLSDRSLLLVDARTLATLWRARGVAAGATTASQQAVSHRNRADPGRELAIALRKSPAYAPFLPGGEAGG